MIKLSHYRPLGLQKFLDNRHMEVVRLLALRTGRLYHPGDIPGNHLWIMIPRWILLWMRNVSDENCREKHFIYIFRVTQLTRILYVLYVHYNMFWPIFTAIIRQLHSVHKSQQWIWQVTHNTCRSTQQKAARTDRLSMQEHVNRFVMHNQVHRPSTRNTGC
jgi:hypothetical protein